MSDYIREIVGIYEEPCPECGRLRCDLDHSPFDMGVPPWATDEQRQGLPVAAGIHMLVLWTTFGDLPGSDDDVSLWSEAKINKLQTGV